MKPDPGRFQDAFVHVLLMQADVSDSAAATPAQERLARLTSQPGFSIYRNTVIKGCIDALQANYPTVTRLVGQEWFRAAAAIHVRAEPPADSRLVLYGAGFPDFLAQFPPAAELIYLADVARIDRSWTEAHCAADAQPLAPEFVAGLGQAAMAAALLQPHPAARWHWFQDRPIYTLWRANREGVDLPEDLPWVGEGVLVTRPRDAVEWTPLSVGGYAFLQSCAASLPLAQAANAALEAQADIDFSSLMASLLRAGAFCAEPAQP
jgi:hypothetical protein